jgi:DNA-binding NarL/FixJ family response regulator
MGDERFLVLEDESQAARQLARIVRAYGLPFVAGSASAAIALLAEFGHWSGFLFDVGLPDGSGLHVLAGARPAHPTTPALILTGNTERETIHAACRLGARYLVKPFSKEPIERFLLDASKAGLSARVERVVHAWAERYRISAAHMDVLRRSALGQDRGMLPAARDCSEQTIDKHVTNLLRRTGDASLHAAVERLLRELA